ncbi:IS3 family transposase [Halomonas urmiana]
MIKEATIRSFHYVILEEIGSQLQNYLWAYNSARPLRTLKGKTPVGFILERWQDELERFHEALSAASRDHTTRCHSEIARFQQDLFPDRGFVK